MESRRKPIFPRTRALTATALLLGAALAVGADAAETPADPTHPRPFSLGRLEQPGPDGTLLTGFGARWSPGTALRHYLGVGAALTETEEDVSSHPSIEDDGAPTVNTWIGAGTSWSPDRGLSVAVAARWAPARVGLPQTEAAPSGFEASGALSWRW